MKCVAFAVALIAGASCGGPGKPPAPIKLCSEGRELSFGARLDDGSASSTQLRFGQLNGSVFLYVSDECEFWVNKLSWFTYYGSLNEAAATELHDAIQFDQLAMAEGSWSTANCLDAPLLSVRAAGGHSECLCGCKQAGTPHSLRQFNDALVSIVDGLSSRGSQWTGEIEILVVEEPTLEDQQPVEWPTEFELATYLTDLNSLGRTDALPDGIVPPPLLLEELRALMDVYAARRPDNTDMGSPLPVIHDGQYYGVYFRDILPLSMPRP